MRGRERERKSVCERETERERERGKGTKIIIFTAHPQTGQGILIVNGQ